MRFSALLGSHGANAAFIFLPPARGLGLGRQMGEHCLAEARRLGFLSMQFRELQLHHAIEVNPTALKDVAQGRISDADGIPEFLIEGFHANLMVIRWAVIAFLCNAVILVGFSCRRSGSGPAGASTSV